MPNVQRQGDPNNAGGAITGGIGSVRVNGKPVAVSGSTVAPHSPYGKKHPPHGRATTTGGSSSVKAAGIPINVDGDSDTCGHVRTSGSSDVCIGG